MPRVTLYSGAYCSYCVQARHLLESKGITVEELHIDGDPALRSEMISKSQRRSVPQIFIGDYHVGGYDDLRRLNSSGKLDELLKA